MSTPISPLALERYELKYLIPLELVEPISRYVEGYCDMDHYSQISPDQFYTINSLYLDSPNLYLLRFKEASSAFCFNMRVRSYGENPKPPYFCEIKYKLREFVRKKRAKINSEEWASYLISGETPPELDAASLDNFENFQFMKMTYNVEPVILTQYRRKAYISNIDDYARVTFDRDLRFQEISDWCLKPEEKMLCHYDHPESFGNSGCNVVLELKCEKKIPLWFVDLIQRFNLMGGSFSKFGNSMATLHHIPEVVTPGPMYL